MKFSNHYNINNSLIDKLINENQSKRFDSKKLSLASINELRTSIRRDLENLLNTRRAQLSWPSEWQELNRSLIAYGVPDITGKILDSAELQNQFCKSIREAIECFESRLKNVKISIIQPHPLTSNILHLRIEALMLVEPNPEPIVFNSILEQEVGVFSLLESAGDMVAI